MVPVTGVSVPTVAVAEKVYGHRLFGVGMVQAVWLTTVTLEGPVMVRPDGDDPLYEPQAAAPVVVPVKVTLRARAALAVVYVTTACTDSVVPELGGLGTKTTPTESAPPEPPLPAAAMVITTAPVAP